MVAQIMVAHLCLLRWDNCMVWNFSCHFSYSQGQVNPRKLWLHTFRIWWLSSQLKKWCSTVLSWAPYCKHSAGTCIPKLSSLSIVKSLLCKASQELWIASESYIYSMMYQMVSKVRYSPVTIYKHCKQCILPWGFPPKLALATESLLSIYHALWEVSSNTS